VKKKKRRTKRNHTNGREMRERKCEEMSSAVKRRAAGGQGDRAEYKWRENEEEETG
jgi:hypothetical protein